MFYKVMRHTFCYLSHSNSRIRSQIVQFNCSSNISRVRRLIIHIEKRLDINLEQAQLVCVFYDAAMLVSQLKYQH